MQSEVIGHLDGLRGDTIVGWALANESICQVTAVDQDGKTLGAGKAQHERPDLLCLNQGRCDFAFEIPLTLGGQVRRIHVFANGSEISNSPLVIEVGKFDGAFRIIRGMVDGWIAERVTSGTPRNIVIKDQDNVEVFKTCCQSNEHIGTSQDNTACFYGKLDQVCFGAGEKCLSAFANDTKFAEVNCNLSLSGNVERVNLDGCSGWLLSTDAPEREFEFQVWVANKLVGLAKCHLPRSDVQERYPGISVSGFSLTFPFSQSSLLDFTTVSFRFPGSDRELFDGPYTIANRAAIVQAAREVSRRGNELTRTANDRVLRIVMQSAMKDFILKARLQEAAVFSKTYDIGRAPINLRRLSVIIPIYRDVEVTKVCIDSVLECRRATNDRIVLVNDQSPDEGMSAMLHTFLQQPNVVLLHNKTNLGFIGSVNRGISFCGSEDILLLNSDTRVFPGSIDCLCRIAQSGDDVGTITAISNNATIFSYPHLGLRRDSLDDMTWQELAAAALELNGDMTVEVPSGHGFCLLIKKELLDRIGRLDESFGRGYGEENDFCARAADLGYRNLAAAGVFVQHRESISFLAEKASLLLRNLKRLEGLYPEYTPTIMEAERQDVLRSARWKLDKERIRRASMLQKFALVISHTLGGGTSKAVADTEKFIGYGDAVKLQLSCRPDGNLELECSQPLLRATFSMDEIEPLIETLSEANVSIVVMHQVLGFTARFVELFQQFVKRRRAIFYAHDFYTFCPRVTMIDALERFCKKADVDVCTRCIEIGGAHPSSQLGLHPGEHRALFKNFLSGFTHVVAPSNTAAAYLKAAFPEIEVESLPHPCVVRDVQNPRSGDNEVVLFGALGAHKGSGKLFELARLARLVRPQLHFTVVGYTDIDDKLSSIGNVSVTGAYASEDLPEMVKSLNGRLALFLSIWPETFSYTLSEAVSLGFFPLVPDIGAPAERVKQSGFGAIFQFPIVVSDVLDLVVSQPVQRSTSGARAFFDLRISTSSISRTREIFGLSACETQSGEPKVLTSAVIEAQPKKVRNRGSKSDCEIERSDDSTWDRNIPYTKRHKHIRTGSL